MLWHALSGIGIQDCGPLLGQFWLKFSWCWIQGQFQHMKSCLLSHCLTTAHNSDITWQSLHLKPQTTQPFVQHLQAFNEANIKPHITGPFARGIYQLPVDSPHKGPVMWQAFPCHDRHHEYIYFCVLWQALSGGEYWGGLDQSCAWCCRLTQPFCHTIIIFNTWFIGPTVNMMAGLSCSFH